MAELQSNLRPQNGAFAGGKEAHHRSLQIRDQKQRQRIRRESGRLHRYGRIRALHGGDGLSFRSRWHSRPGPELLSLSQCQKSKIQFYSVGPGSFFWTIRNAWHARATRKSQHYETVAG